MDRSQAFILLLAGAVLSGPVDFSGSVLNRRVRPGDNVTLYCGCKSSSSEGEFTRWYRNCSHVNQPTLELTTGYPDKDLNVNFDEQRFLHPFPRMRLLKNESSASYDLLITNVTHADEGLYYCGSAKQHSGTSHVVRRDAKTVNLSVAAPHTESPDIPCAECWTLLLTLCPALTLLSSLLSSAVVYRFCRKTVHQADVDQKRSESHDHTRAKQDEDVCYIALDIRKTAQRQKKKNPQSSSFCTYSAINTSRM